MTSSSCTQNRLARLRYQFFPSGLETEHKNTCAFNNVSASMNASSLIFPPIRVLVTGAAGQIGYNLLSLIASGQMFGPSQPVILQLLETEHAMEALRGVVMELEDCAYSLVHQVIATSDISVAFRDVSIALLVGSMPRGKSMERKDLITKNAAVFKEQGNALEKYASRNVRILVVGNPANTNCCIVAACAPSIPRKNFSALTRLDMNRCRSHLAGLLTKKLNQFVDPKHVRNTIIWGNHSLTQYPDVSHATYSADSHQFDVHSVREVLCSDFYLDGEFIRMIQNRGAAVISARGMSSAMSAARAICDHMRDWICGTTTDEWVSMAVLSDESYGIPKGLVFSYPVRCPGNGQFEIVRGLKTNQLWKEKIDITTKELIEERNTAFQQLKLTMD
ncbi:uncharacterized protein LOC126304666 [Schistocerca gregaria]|uniref:uncharacterized protein LOC126304666 n=1 Tax=Schistocerca gregaria TaxID=7010 RepID=UPI00211F07BE|nr:uncharacterized protein LOC126304666 [Schistocerca gregaria]